MVNIPEIENSKDRITDVHQTILDHLGDSLPLVPQIARHLLKQQKGQLRSRLTIRCAELFQSADQRVLDLAGILEFLHASTKLHRRVQKPGESRRQLKPLQGIWGNEASVLLGDYLLSISFEILTRAGNLEVLETISSTTQKIALGQMLEVSKPYFKIGSKDWEEITLLKHASLFQAGAVCASIWGKANTEITDNLGKFGCELGMASRLAKDLETVCNHAQMVQALQQEKLLYPVCLWLEKGMGSRDSKTMKKLLSESNTGSNFDDNNWKNLLQWCWVPVEQKIEEHLEGACYHLKQIDELDCSNLKELTELKMNSAPETLS